ncbi:Immune inhibitor A peptidase M6 [Dehalogenimonas alkenigignens]|uniref:Immune inhibitor A peptidase M6 n=1 Tax=Dehalogenimonas alkenigignens TaxID=1217799 RepID=A0A0W0GHT0_9CHLR|nr:immune inhibitor A domain-containing protein [Dehalogenimonas alkenigignens]KTB48121.1 Immune inhibitor A peptidase M6 [Dehalogenimonas alkenigignens]
MLKKAVSRFTAVLLALGVLVLLLPAAIPAAAAKVDYVPTDVGPKIRQWEATVDRIVKDDQPTGSSNVNASSLTVLDTKIFLILNDYFGSYQATYFYLVSESSKTQVWVQVNLAWTSGDPRTTPSIDDTQISYILNQFDNVILPTETDFFGGADPHDGSTAYLPGLLGLPSDYYFDSGGRNIVLISNIRDENYYDSTYPIYIAGFYSPSFEVYFDRNVITIDAYDWANRLGPDGTRAYLYEGVVAHEWQHLLHDDYDPDEETFINEGMSEYAEILCGYTQSLQGHLDAAAENPENSLVVWGDQGDEEILTDYGQAALFQIYLNEQFGRTFTQVLFHNPGNGISGVNSALSQMRINKTFSDLYHDFSVALLINSVKAGSKYAIKTFPGFKLDIGSPASPNLESYSLEGAPPWGTDYIWLDGNAKELLKFQFNGVPYSIFPTRWSSDDGWLWSGVGDLIDNWAIFETTGGGTLSFDTIWNLEDYWDFGFVQVSVDGGYTWSSLSNAYTTSDHDPNAHPTVIANLPGLTSYISAPINMRFDLSAYAGQDILIAFRCVTDWATYYGGWWVDNVYVDGELISDGTDASVFKDISQLFPVDNDYTVTFVAMKNSGKNKPGEYKVLTLRLDSVTDTGLFELNQILIWADQVVMLVTYDAPEGVTFYSDYSYEFGVKNSKLKK